MKQEYYLKLPNNLDAFPEKIRDSFTDKYDVSIRVKHKPHFFNDEGTIEFIIAGRDGIVESSWDNKCYYHQGKFDLYTIDGMLIIGGFDYYEFDLNKFDEFHERTFILYWNTRSYGVDRGVYISYKREPSTLWYDFSKAVGLVLDLDFNTYVNHYHSVSISPRGVFRDKIELIERIGWNHILEGYVSCCRHYIVSDFYIEGKDLSFIEDGKIVSSNLFQDLQAPRYNCDFLVVINDKVGLFSKEGYRVNPTYDSGYSDNCHYSFILAQDGKKRYWDVDYKTYKITEGQFDFHIKYLEESCKDSLLTKESLAQVEYSIRQQCEHARMIKEHPELEKKPSYEPNEWTEEDTWDVMTDGMYGEYPGSGFDYELLGF